MFCISRSRPQSANYEPKLANIRVLGPDGDDVGALDRFAQACKDTAFVPTGPPAGGRRRRERTPRVSSARRISLYCR